MCLEVMIVVDCAGGKYKSKAKRRCQNEMHVCQLCKRRGERGLDGSNNEGLSCVYREGQNGNISLKNVDSDYD